MYYPMMWGGAFSLLWTFFMIVGIIALIIWFRSSGYYENKGKWHHFYQMKKPSIGVLEERYAKGEIDKKEFEERRKVLMAEYTEPEEKEENKKKEES